jgi:hypothetical protein
MNAISHVWLTLGRFAEGLVVYLLTLVFQALVKYRNYGLVYVTTIGNSQQGVRSTGSGLEFFLCTSASPTCKVSLSRGLGGWRVVWMWWDWRPRGGNTRSAQEGHRRSRKPADIAQIYNLKSATRGHSISILIFKG